MELQGDEVVRRLELVISMKLSGLEKIRELVGAWPNIWAVVDETVTLGGSEVSSQGTRSAYLGTFDGQGWRLAATLSCCVLVELRVSAASALPRT